MQRQRITQHAQLHMKAAKAEHSSAAQAAGMRLQ
jgi:hypothetical protein